MLDWEQEAEILVSRFGTVRIKAAIESMSEAYRLGKGTKGPRLDGEILVAAYLAVRFPATLAANRAVLRAVNDSLRTRGVDPEFAPESLLDLGAGCGAAIIAAQEAWGALREVTAIEQIAAMVQMGKQLLPDVNWRTSAIEAMAELPMHDVVVFSYSIGEEAGRAAAILARAWKAAGSLLIVIEPGTPAGFETIDAARTQLIGLGASIAAPCSAPAACPARGVDWCHFAARLNRSAVHRRLKGGSLGYEDEKYSYIAAWRGELRAGAPRVIRHPLVQPGRIEVEICEAPLRGKVLTTKRSKAHFRQARKLAWGDEFVLDAAAGPE